MMAALTPEHFYFVQQGYMLDRTTESTDRDMLKAAHQDGKAVDVDLLSDATAALKQLRRHVRRRAGLHAAKEDRYQRSVLCDQLF